MVEQQQAAKSCTVQFSGGLEMYFHNKRELKVDLISSAPANGASPGPYTMRDLIAKLRVQYMSEKEEMFAQADTVRPGIIVLINDTDWELEDQLDYQLQHNDTVAFISTLHGG